MQMYRIIPAFYLLSLFLPTTSAAPTAAFPAKCSDLPNQNFKEVIEHLNVIRQVAQNKPLKLTAELTKVAFHHVNNLECTAEEFPKTKGCNVDDPGLGWRGDASSASEKCQLKPGVALGCCGKDHVECANQRMKNNTNNGDYRVTPTVYKGDIIDQQILWSAIPITQANRELLLEQFLHYTTTPYFLATRMIQVEDAYVGVSHAGRYLVILTGTKEGENGSCKRRGRSMRGNRTLVMPQPAPDCNAGMGLEEEVYLAVNSARNAAGNSNAILAYDLHWAAHYKAQNLAAEAPAGGCQVPTGRSSRENCANDKRSWKPGKDCYPAGATPPTTGCCQSDPKNTKPCWDGKFAMFNKNAQNADADNFIAVAGTKSNSEKLDDFVQRLMFNKHNFETLVEHPYYTQIGGYISDTHYSFILAKASVEPSTRCFEKEPEKPDKEKPGKPGKPDKEKPGKPDKEKPGGGKTPGKEDKSTAKPADATTSGSFKCNIFTALSIIVAATSAVL